MQVFTLFVSYLHHLLGNPTPEQASVIVKGCCSIGGLLLQYLSYRRGNKGQTS